MGLSSYYYRFIKGFAAMTSHMTYLNYKDVLFIWNKKCEESFLKLKALLISSPILSLLVEDKDFIIYCDAL